MGPVFSPEPLQRLFAAESHGRQVRPALTEHEVKGLLREWGFPVPRGVLVKSLYEDLSEATATLVFPVAAKVSSRRIASKSDVGGVRLAIRDDQGLASAVRDLFRLPEAEGVLVEEMAPQGLEVIIGGVVDRQFGPVVMFGVGGLMVELFRDVVFALAPTDRQEALRLIGRTKAHRLLSGYRGRPPVDQSALAGMITAVSDVIACGLVDEIDLNPVILYPEGAMVVDAKISVAGLSYPQPQP